MRYSRRSAATLAGAALGLFGAMSLATELATADTIGAGPAVHAPAVAPAVLTLGTYKIFLNGASAGTISFAPDFTYTSTIDGGDAGSWIEMNDSFTLDFTSGVDSGQGCVFAGNVTSTTTIDSAADPGTYACPGLPATGTWYVKGSGSSPAQASSALSVAPGSAVSSSGFSTGRYSFFENDVRIGRVTYAHGHTFTSTVDESDSGSWAASGKAFGMVITGGAAADAGCLFVGTVSSTGLNSSADPAPYTECDGADTQVGIWWAKKK